MLLGFFRLQKDFKYFYKHCKKKIATEQNAFAKTLYDKLGA